MLSFNSLHLYTVIFSTSQNFEKLSCLSTDEAERLLCTSSNIKSSIEVVVVKLLRARRGYNVAG